MAEIIQCPSCRRAVNLPAELIGRTVQCPECGVNFIAMARPEPRPTPEGAFQERVPPSVEPERAGGDLDEFERQRIQSLLKTPAIILLILTILGGLIALQNGFLFASDPQGAIQRIRGALERAGVDARTAADTAEQIAPIMLPIAVFEFFCHVITALGAVMMLRQRLYGLAVAGCILAMININCCCIELPFGLWGLVLLTQSNVRATFQ